MLFSEHISLPDNTLVAGSLVLAAAGVVLGIFGFLFSLLLNIHRQPPVTFREAKPLVKIAYMMASGAGGLLGLAIIGLIAAGIWWCLLILIAHVSPGSLALISLAFGISPLLVASLAGFIASRIGGTLNAAGAENCIFMGRDIGSILYTMFMMHWLTIFTGGIAVFGLIGSGLWAIFR